MSVFAGQRCCQITQEKTAAASKRGRKLTGCVCCVLLCLCLQDNDAAKYWEFSRLNHELSKGVTLRGMLRFKKAPGGAIPLDEVRIFKQSSDPLQEFAVAVCFTLCKHSTA
jgi:hypothetical protein